MLELLKRLIEQRARLWEGTKTELLDKIHEEKRDFTAEEAQEFDRRNADLDDLDERIKSLNDRIQREASADEARAAAEALIRPREERRENAEPTIDEKADAFFRSGQRGAFDIPLSGLRVERHGAGNWDVRDLTVGTASAGGATFNSSFRKSLYEHLIENTAMRRTRAEIITTGAGEALILPKTTAHTGAGTIVAEAALINEADPTFGQGTLNAYKYAKTVQVSVELIQDTQVDLLGYLARSFGQALGNGSGADYVIGTGSSAPEGVLVGASTTRQVTGGTFAFANGPTADQLISLFYTVTEPYANNGEWLMRRATVGKVRSLKDNNGQYLWQPSIQVGQPETILGHPVVMDPNVPASASAATSVAFGDFSAYKIRDVGSLRFERSDEFAFANDLVTFKVALRTDGRLLDTTGAIGTFKHGTV